MRTRLGTATTVPTSETPAVSLEFEQIIGACRGDGKLLLPQGIDVQEGTGNIYISDSQNDRVAVFDKEGSFLFDFGQDQIDESANLEFNNITGQIFVGDVKGNEIDVFEPDGTYVRSFGEFTVGTDRPCQLPSANLIRGCFVGLYLNSTSIQSI